MKQRNYPTEYADKVMRHWESNKADIVPLSMRKFCEEWDIPRSTLREWITKKNNEALSPSLFYKEPGTANKAAVPLDKNVIAVLRLLSNELTALSMDLDAILDPL